MNITDQLVTSVKWASFSKVIRILLQYVTLLILAYFLSPKDFGLMSTAMIFIGFFNLIKDFGFSSALIRLDEESVELFSSVFWLNFFFGITFSAVIFFSSETIANYYEIPELKEIIRILSLSFLFSSLTALPNSILEKKMKFNLISKIEITANFLASFTAIILAFLRYGVWALVFQNLIFVFTLMILTWFNVRFIPRLVLKKHEIKKVMNFGVHLSGFNILNYFVRNADYFLIGKFLGMQSLGYYSFAYRIMLFPIQNITSVIGRVLYPALSKVKNDNLKAQNIYLNVSKSVAFITFPLMIIFFVINRDFVTIFFSEKWLPIIPLLYVLIPVGMIQSVYTLAGSIFLVKNKTRLWFYWGIFSAVITVTGFYIGLNWGILGVAISYLITNLLLITPGSYLAFNLINLKLFTFVKNLSVIFLISLLAGISTYLLKILIQTNSLISLIISVSFGFLFYAGLSYKFNKELLTKLFAKAI